MITLGVISAISLVLLIFLLLKQLKSQTRKTDAIEHERSRIEVPQEAENEAKTDVADSSSDSLEQEGSSGDSIYDNHELCRR